jgi:cyclophilin family peptidyl-prolyl cis-trans isomerase
MPLRSTAPNPERPSHLSCSAVGTALTLISLAALDACGGGGSTGGTPTATVTSTSVAATRYGAPALVTINGTGLDSTLAVTSAGCKNMTLLTAAPTASTSTTAYYSCTVSGAFSSTVVAKSNNTTVGSANFTVLPPVVTMAVSDGVGVNGNLVITLEGDKAPITVDNFLAYVNAGFYGGLIFHRVSNLNHVIQGGGFGTMTDGNLPVPKATNPPIVLETTGGSNVQWSVGMARTSMPNTATSQFYINTAANPGFDGNYAVFGNLTASSVVVAQSITTAACTPLTGATDDSCVPIPNVVITSAVQTQ